MKKIILQPLTTHFLTCVCAYLIKLKELFPLFMCAAASNRGDVQHAITEFNECPPVKNNMLVLSAFRTGVGHHNQVYTSKCYTTFLVLLCAHSIIPSFHYQI